MSPYGFILVFWMRSFDAFNRLAQNWRVRQLPRRAMSDLNLMIRAGRRALGMSQRELADAAGVSRATIFRMEQGKSTSTKTVEKLRLCLATLGVEVATEVDDYLGRIRFRVSARERLAEPGRSSDENVDN